VPAPGDAGGRALARRRRAPPFFKGLSTTVMCHPEGYALRELPPDASPKRACRAGLVGDSSVPRPSSAALASAEEPSRA
jgi:hypothetical protein